MKADKWKFLKENRSKELVPTLIEHYKKIIKNAPNKPYTHATFRNDLDGEYANIQYDNLSIKDISILTIQAQIAHFTETQRALNYSELFEKFTPLLNEEQRIKVIEQLAKIEAYRKFTDYVYKQDKNYLPKHKEPKIIEPILKPDSTLRQIALIKYYEGISINRKNANDIVTEYGHHSGERLFQLFTRYSSRTNRIGSEATLKKNLNKLKLFESIIPKLSSAAKQKAKDEMNTLKTSFESD